MTTKVTPNLTNIPLGTKNVIINGNFDIWQRGTLQTTPSYGSDDRWLNGQTGSTKTASRQTFTLGQSDVPNNPKYYSKTVATSVAGADNYVAKYQKIEGVATFAGETCTLSFWAKADAAKNIAIEFHQNFGTGGSPSVFVTASVDTVSLTTSWAKYTVTVTLPSISGKTLGTNGNDWVGPLLWFDAGSNLDARTNSLGQQSGTFDIAQVQFEKGDVATDFEWRSFGDELALCQRYYHNYPNDTIFISNTGTATHSTSVAVSIFYPLSMRDTPTITLFNPSHISGESATNITTGGFLLSGTATAGLGARISHYTADAEL